MSNKTSQQTLRRYHFTAERIDQTTYQADVSVIAQDETEAFDKAQAEADEGPLYWGESATEEGYPDLRLAQVEDATEEEVEEYLEEQRRDDEAFINDLRSIGEADWPPVNPTLAARLEGITASLRAAATEEERTRLIDELEGLIR